MAESELCDLVVQLAQFCRVNDPTALHILECTAQLSEVDLSALDRFFSLFLSYSKQVSLLSINIHAFTLCLALLYYAPNVDDRENR
jgi:hypothetical protein